MEKYHEVIKRTLELLETIREGIQHIQEKLLELRYEEALIMLQDIVEGVASIESAIEPMMTEFVENNIESLTTILKENVSKAVGSYENGKEINMERLAEEGILLAFKKWKLELERVMKAYIILKDKC